MARDRTSLDEMEEQITRLELVNQTLLEILSGVRKELPRFYYKIDKLGRMMKEFDEMLDLMPSPVVPPSDASSPNES